MGNLLANLYQIAYPLLYNISFRILLHYMDKFRFRHALRSAVAAIMARNMDHLLGSHIETSIAHQMRDLRREIHDIGHKFNIISTPPPSSSNPNGCTEDCYRDDFWMDSSLRRNKTNRDTRAQIDRLIQNLEQEYSNYRLKRMDLIARFSTEWIPWGVGMSFFHQVMVPFMRNGILLHFLGRGEGIRLQNIEIKVLYPTISNCKLNPNPAGILRVKKQGQPCEIPSYSLVLSSSSNFETEFHVPMADFMTIRGGDIGAHAFHIFLENVLRNSAKHGRFCDQSKQIKLRIWVVGKDTQTILDKIGFKPVEERKEQFGEVIQRDQEGYWFVVVSSSPDYKNDNNQTENLAKEIDGLLCRSLIRETGETDPEAWGMKEMKICSAYLAEGSPENADSNKPDYLWAGTIPWENGQQRLAYCLKIPKARLLLYLQRR